MLRGTFQAMPKVRPSK